MTLRPFGKYIIFVIIVFAGWANVANTQSTTSGIDNSHDSVALQGYPKRPYDIFIPSGLKKPAPLLLILHGGGSDAVNAIRVTCPNGNLSDPHCITGHAIRNKYIVVAPRGTSKGILGHMRTWNAGGGDANKTWICTSGLACKKDVDDVGYFNTLLDTLQDNPLVDMQRVYATGISNGAAMAHRLACEMPHRIAAIAAVAGANQLSTVQGCKTDHPVPILQIHGTEDCAWPYAGGPPKCRGAHGFEGSYIGLDNSMHVWSKINKCSGKTTTTELTDHFEDDTTVTRFDWHGCKAPTVSYRINGGGHTWPNGFQYFSAKRIGNVSQELTNDHIWTFLSSHRIP